MSIKDGIRFAIGMVIGKYIADSMIKLFQDKIKEFKES